MLRDDRQGRPALRQQREDGRARQVQGDLPFTSPEANGFLRHIDKETGVPDWWQPFSETFTFSYPQR